MHHIKGNFDIFLPIVKSFFKENTFLRQNSQMKFTDEEIITLSLVAESLGIDSENLLFKKLNTEYKDAFPNLIDRTRYNRRRRRLQHFVDRFRIHLVKCIAPYEDTFILDSMPIEV